MTDIKYPIALHGSSGKLIEAINAENGINCNCVCFDCKGAMIAVNRGKIQQAHFRHHVTENCTASYESYIHWLSKEVFKELDYILIPPIYARNLDYESNIQYSKAVYKELRELDLKKEELYRSLKSILLQGVQKVEFKDLLIEKVYQSDAGDIRADVVLSIENVDLIIEPFFTNVIDEFKFQKLQYMDITTLSIDLSRFIIAKSHFFELKDFKNYLQEEIENKEWIYIRDSKRKKLEKELFRKISNKFSSSKNEREVYVDQNKKIKELNDKRTILISKQNELEKEFNEVTREIGDVQRELNKHKKIAEDAFNTIIKHIER